MSVDYYKILEKYNLEKGILRGDELLCCCPLHDDKNPSFSINLKTGKYICFAGCGAGDFIDLISKLENVGRASAEDLINNDSDDKNTQLDRLNEELKFSFVYSSII